MIFYHFKSDANLIKSNSFLNSSLMMFVKVTRYSIDHLTPAFLS